MIHVSWFEADAYARWIGKRLPTEQEWDKAAARDPSRTQSRRYPCGEAEPTRDLANLGHRLLEVTPVGSYPRGRNSFGCHQMLGDVYEWTASDSLPYPEFMARSTYRKWDHPQRRQLFAGFRCAS